MPLLRSSGCLLSPGLPAPCGEVPVRSLSSAYVHTHTHTHIARVRVCSCSVCVYTTCHQETHTSPSNCSPPRPSFKSPPGLPSHLQTRLTDSTRWLLEDDHHSSTATAKSPFFHSRFIHSCASFLSNLGAPRSGEELRVGACGAEPGCMGGGVVSYSPSVWPALLSP